MAKYSFKKKAVLAILGLTSVVCASTAAAQENIRQEIGQYISKAPFRMEAPALPQIPSHEVSITAYGAVGDGHRLNTEAFAKTISSCAAAGGGTVIVPPGLWLTGPIELKSNINLHLQQGAVILFSPDHSLYPLTTTSSTGSNYFVMPPVYGYNLQNVAITGDGIFNGSGDSWRPVKKEKTTDAQWKKLLGSGGVVSQDGKMWWPTREAMEGEGYMEKIGKNKKRPGINDYLPARDFLRPYMISLTNCDKVLLDGPTFMNSPKFALCPKNCNDLVIRNVKINNEWYAQNGDGIDISGCKRVVIYKCTVNAGDDGICMKSSRPSSDKGSDACLREVIIADCIVYQAHGGFVIGSNTDGGMENIYVNNCDFINTDVGIRVKSRRGSGGLVHHIYVSNIYLYNIADEAILFDSYYEQKKGPRAILPVTLRTPDFRDFYISNINCNRAGAAISITGLPEMPVSRIFFSDINITADKGFTAVDTAAISLHKVIINDHEYDQ